MHRLAAALAGSGFAFLAAVAAAQPSPYPPTNMPASPLFPPDNWWNVDVSGVTADAAQTASFMTFLTNWHATHPSASANPGIHGDWGGDVDPSDPTNPEIYGMVYFTVPGTQPRTTVSFDIDDQSDTQWASLVGYPIPSQAITQRHWIEGGYPGQDDQGSDQHMLIVDRDNRLLYELWQTRYNAGLARWEAGSGAIFPLDGNYRRPDTWTSGDAAGLAILPGLVRFDEVRPDLVSAPAIRHAFRVTVANTLDSYVFPASHRACNSPCPTTGLPMGARLRLKSTANATIPGDATAAEAAAIGRMVTALKTYGLIVADNGSSLFIQGAYDPRWNMDPINGALGTLHASDFEVLPLGFKPTDDTLGAATSFFTLTPCRLLDTRNPPGLTGGPALTANVARSVQLNTSCGIPATATALSLNVTVVNTPGTGSLRVFPGHLDAVPNTNVVSYRAGTTRADNVVVALSPASHAGTVTTRNGMLKLYSTLSGVHVVVDVNGYFQ